jgi:ABC-2 type transport system ATP-binding protein
MEVVIKNLTKVYDNGHKALDDVSFTIGSGMFGLLGPNGAGKSSLMNILVTLNKATSGQILVDGNDLETQRKKVRQMMGYLPQDFTFFSKLKSYEFLDYSASLAGIKSKKERSIAVDKMLENVGLYEFRNRQANKLSGGMKRRLGIAQALIGDPKVIVVDEPTTGLDPEERIRFRNLLGELSQKDVSIILSTHIVGDISSSCEDMVLLNKGQVSFSGSPDELIAKARGHVFQLTLNDEQLDIIKRKYPIVSTTPFGMEWEVQVVAEDVGDFKHTLIEPNLEHAYVYFMDNVLNEELNMQIDAVL